MNAAADCTREEFLVSSRVSLADLPAPPADKTGWPWTEESERVPAGSPRISIVTPSYNQGPFLEETIRSVLLQGYPDLEYIVIDGGSTDESVAILRKYEKWLTYWVSQSDHGQADAIRKGLEKVTGPICAYLNSDDIYMKNTFGPVARRFAVSPAPDVVYGNMYRIDPHDRIVEEHRNTPYSRWGYLYGGFFLHQPATFWKTGTIRSAGGVNPEFRFEMDNDLFMRLALRKARFSFERQFVAGFRVHPTSKSSTIMHVSKAENEKMRQKYLPFPFSSLRGGLIRNAARAQRVFWYACQGDLGWLLKRVFQARNQTG